MIKHLTVKGLNGKTDFSLPFNEDINIVTGKNGSGKTTALKLIWYILSGNLDRIVPDIYVDYVKLETDTFTVELTVDREKEGLVLTSFTPEFPSDPQMRLPLALSHGRSVTYKRPDGVIERRVLNPMGELTREILSLSENSLFFPTFRRIEGGFQASQRRPNYRESNLTAQLQGALADLSEQLSTQSHRFVASISTEDIVELLTRTYADISEKTNNLHVTLSAFITNTITDYSTTNKKSETESLADAQATLQLIQAKVVDIALQRESLLKPFSTLSGLIESIFQHQGIKVTDSITLGDTQNAIASDKLSAGEKHMLSFLCYNATLRGGVILIDEPEISLNVDWQRILFPTLQAQQTDNQFIVATHSPFIYSKYADKELVLEADRGGE